MIKPISDQGFGKDIFARYENPISPLLPADMTFLKEDAGEEEIKPDVRYETYLNNITEINNSKEENVILNLKVDLHFLNKMLTRTLPSTRISGKNQKKFLENLTSPKGREELGREISTELEPLISKETADMVLKETDEAEESGRYSETSLNAEENLKNKSLNSAKLKEARKEVEKIKRSIFEEEKLLKEKKKNFTETDDKEERKALELKIEEKKALLRKRELLLKETFEDEINSKEIERENTKRSDFFENYVLEEGKSSENSLKSENLNKASRESYVPKAKVIYKEEKTAPEANEIKSNSYRNSENAFLSRETIVYRKEHPVEKEEVKAARAPSDISKRPAADAFLMKAGDERYFPKTGMILAPDVILKGINKVQLKMADFDKAGKKKIKLLVPKEVKEIIEKGPFITRKYSREEVLKNILREEIVLKDTDEKLQREESYSPEETVRLEVLKKIYKENKLPMFMNTPMELKKETEYTEEENETSRLEKVYIEKSKEQKSAGETKSLNSSKPAEDKSFAKLKASEALKVLNRDPSLSREVIRSYFKPSEREILKALDVNNEEKKPGKKSRVQEIKKAESLKKIINLRDVANENQTSSLNEMKNVSLLEYVLSENKPQSMSKADKEAVKIVEKEIFRDGNIEKLKEKVFTPTEKVILKTLREDVLTENEVNNIVNMPAEKRRSVIEKAVLKYRFKPLSLNYKEVPGILGSTITTPDGDITLGEVINYVNNEKSPAQKEKIKYVNLIKSTYENIPMELSKPSSILSENINEENIDHSMKLNSSINPIKPGVKMINREVKRELTSPERSEIRYNNIENTGFVTEIMPSTETERISYREVRVPEISMIYKKAEEKREEESKKQEEVIDDIVTIKKVINNPEEKKTEKNVAINAPAPLTSGTKTSENVDPSREITKIADKVYKMLEKRLRFENIRRGGF